MCFFAFVFTSSVNSGCRNANIQATKDGNEPLLVPVTDLHGSS